MNITVSLFGIDGAEGSSDLIKQDVLKSADDIKRAFYALETEYDLGCPMSVERTSERCVTAVYSRGDGDLYEVDMAAEGGEVADAIEYQAKQIGRE